MTSLGRPFCMGKRNGPFGIIMGPVGCPCGLIFVRLSGGFHESMTRKRSCGQNVWPLVRIRKLEVQLQQIGLSSMAVMDLIFSVSPPCLGSVEASLLGFSSTWLTTPRGNVVAFKHPSRTTCQVLSSRNRAPLSQFKANDFKSRRLCFRIPRCTGSSSSDATQDEKSSSEQTKTPFGYTRKDVLLIGVGVTVIGVGLKSGLEYAGVDPLLAGNVVQLVVVLGLTIGWISTYMFRVSNKEMTYAQQLRDYEDKVMQKRLEGLTEAELEALLEQVAEEKRQLTSSEQAQ